MKILIKSDSYAEAPSSLINQEIRIFRGTQDESDYLHVMKFIIDYIVEFKPPITE